MQAQPSYDARIAASVHLFAAQWALSEVPEFGYVVAQLSEFRDELSPPRLRLVPDAKGGADS